MSLSAAKIANNKLRTLDVSKHGVVIQTPFDKGWFKAPLIAARWDQPEFLVTVPWYIQSWDKWPQGHGKTPFKRDMRQGARMLSTLAIRAALPDVDLGYEEGVTPWLPGLAPYLESLGVVRITPPQRNVFEEDSLIHWCHHLRDGVYDVFAGAKMQRNKRLRWLGQDKDDNNKKGFIPFQYNQLRMDGHGVVFVFRFKQAFVEGLKLTG